MALSSSITSVLTVEEFMEMKFQQSRRSYQVTDCTGWKAYATIWLHIGVKILHFVQDDKNSQVVRGSEDKQFIETKSISSKPLPRRVKRRQTKNGRMKCQKKLLPQ
jgi:hypothetical protein